MQVQRQGNSHCYILLVACTGLDLHCPALTHTHHFSCWCANVAYTVTSCHFVAKWLTDTMWLSPSECQCSEAAYTVMPLLLTIRWAV